MNRNRCRCRWQTLLLVAVVMLGPGCKSANRAPYDRVTVQASLSAPVVATLLSAALRSQLSAAAASFDAGAAVSTMDDAFVVSFELGPDGDWLPCADRHVRLQSPDARGAVSIGHAHMPQLRAGAGFGRSRVAIIELRVRPCDGGCQVDCFAPSARGAEITSLIDRTLSLASDDERGGPGAAEPNLIAWRLGMLLQAARDAVDGGDRAILLRRAARLPGAPSAVYEELGELTAAAGQMEQALAQLRHAALCCPDPVRRALIARRVRRAVDRASQPAGLRQDALGNIVSGDLPGAEQQLHSARRAAPCPRIDYQLLGVLHRYRGDEVAALAAELLAREHEADPSEPGSDRPSLPATAATRRPTQSGDVPRRQRR